MTSHASYYPVMEFCAQYYRLITGITCGINTAVLVLLRYSREPALASPRLGESHKVHVPLLMEESAPYA